GTGAGTSGSGASGTGGGTSGQSGSGGTGSSGTSGGTGGASSLPMDGNQLTVCNNAVDCNRGFNCYGGGQYSGYCTKSCMMASDCTTLGGGYTYTCTQNLCVLSCTGMDDTNCPSGMTCQQVTGFGGPGFGSGGNGGFGTGGRGGGSGGSGSGGTGGMMPTYRCRYPAGAAL